MYVRVSVVPSGVTVRVVSVVEVAGAGTTGLTGVRTVVVSVVVVVVVSVGGGVVSQAESRLRATAAMAAGLAGIGLMAFQVMMMQHCAPCMVFLLAAC
jgi:hypothetical protein